MTLSEHRLRDRLARGPWIEILALRDCKMRLSKTVDWVFSAPTGGRRPRRRLVPAVRPLEGRQLLSAAPTATMSQTATFPNLESMPDVATQAFLYYSSTMG